ncbi:MAG: 2-polyprenyl-3-methyl-6-methoxy-1,4-benzoquinone monooxygenase [Gammaproteobacteria bacterium]|jgi:ubiquinone biosynthesis monooxygenase Coq7
MPSLDNILKELDYAIDVLHNSRLSDELETNLTNDDQKQSQRVMRVNHMGEVCAQALYRGQAMTTKDSNTRKIILKMCEEEMNHLTMCENRLTELSGQTSSLNSLWYASSFLLGAYVGLLDKDKSLGFIYETEDQVEQHLDEYTKKLPSNDDKSRKILENIKIDESKHKNTAKSLGSSDLSIEVKNLMALSSKVMKKISFYF